ncbi:hypothetical protein MTBLM5_80077 [Magnetospirillum sp. LM-5]|uniref:hypothetical protein n=1 Tax=Magnetospirillum sp. LM-5 TaxID=2681466 RepID=UPI0013807D13|nr:hypothetical protein [Magnetospirillum sp. LM-5]CAA7625423.1 hypothetical protein MTBLM5_80077 [Magnetospirillum sp. LM-5]
MPLLKRDLDALRIAAIANKDFIDLSVNDLRLGIMIQDVADLDGWERSLAFLASVWLRAPFEAKGIDVVVTNYCMMLRGIAALSLPIDDDRCRRCRDGAECPKGNLCMSSLIANRIEAAKRMTKENVSALTSGHNHSLGARTLLVDERITRYREYARDRLRRRF